MTTDLTATDPTTNDTGNMIALETYTESFVTVTLVTPTGTDTVNVPAQLASDDMELRNVLTTHGISMAANALIERDPVTGEIKLTKQVDHNG